MTHKVNRRLYAWGAIIVAGLVAVLLAAGALGQVMAQEDMAQGAGELRTSSARPPAGTSLEDLSPPDSPGAGRGPDESQGGGLVSRRTPGSPLKPRQNDVNYSVSGGGACTYVTSGNAGTVWNIEPNLPQGAVVDTLRTYYYDTSGSNYSSWFTIYNLYGNIVQEWGATSSGNSGNGFNDSTTINHTVDYSVYNYALNWRPNASGSTLQLCGFRLFYEPPPFGLGFLPSITND